MSLPDTTLEDVAGALNFNLISNPEDFGGKGSEIYSNKNQDIVEQVKDALTNPVSQYSDLEVRGEFKFNTKKDGDIYKLIATKN